MPLKPPTFRAHGAPPPGEAQRSYERRRGSARARGYTRRWELEAARYRRLNPLCVCCAARGYSVAVAVVDHVLPHDGDDRTFWDRGNWQSLCAWCHDVVKQRLEVLWRRGEATAEDLRLTSQRALALADRLRP